MGKIRLLKDIDRVVGKPLVFFSRRIGREERRPTGPPERILIIRPGGIGDAVLLLPAVKVLRSKLPDARMDVLCEKRNAGIFELAEGINTIYLYDNKFDLFRCLRNRYDVVIDTEQWHRLSAVVAYLAKAAVRIGFDTNDRGRLFTHKIPYSHDDYEVYSFFRLVEPLIGAPSAFDPGRPFIDIGNDVPVPLAESSGGGRDWVAVFPGASVPERRWGGERFGLVAKALTARGYKVVVLGSGADRADADKIREVAKDSIDLTGRTTLESVTAILRRCLLLVTADSGLLHIACAVGTPTVSLFGSGIEKKWGPKGGGHITINKNLACSPCTKFGYTPRCRRGMVCLSSIGVDEVTEAAVNILADRRE